MARMVSPAGEMEVRITGITAEGSEMVLSGRFGAWESKIYLDRSEVAQTVRMMLNWQLVRFLLLLPFALLAPWCLGRLRSACRRSAASASGAE